MVDAVSRLDEAPRTLLLGPVASARRDAEAELTELRDKVHAASLLLQGLPAFLGADGAPEVLRGSQNPAELRGTGGLIGAYSILTIDEGHFRFEPFEPIQSLPTPVGEVPAPNDDYATNYEPFRGGDRFWTAINVMPDFPSVAQAILSSYEASTRRTARWRDPGRSLRARRTAPSDRTCRAPRVRHPDRRTQCRPVHHE